MLRRHERTVIDYHLHFFACVILPLVLAFLLLLRAGNDWRSAPNPQYRPRVPPFPGEQQEGLVGAQPD
jgi:hypothetical protein